MDYDDECMMPKCKRTHTVAFEEPKVKRSKKSSGEPKVKRTKTSSG